jgi:MOSC domain-containing protein YiiM
MEQVHVLPGHGIQGDRYFQKPGASNAKTRTGREITLIEIEAIESMCQDGVRITPDQTRRNIITRGIALNDLVGKTFMVGEIQLKGIRLCEPCDYLASRTDPKIKQSMVHRGGLRADILSEGAVHIDDPITTLKEQA